MEAVANGGLRYLGNQCLRIAQQQALELATQGEFCLQHLRLHANSVACALDHGPVGHGSSSHEESNPHHTIIASQSHFGRGAVFHSVKQRDNRRRWEVDVIQMSAEFVDDIAKGKKDLLKGWEQAFDFVRWQSG